MIAFRCRSALLTAVTVVLAPVGFTSTAASQLNTRLTAPEFDLYSQYPQEYPAAASDGPSYLVVWQESRNGDIDVYGARIGDHGLILTGPFPIAAGPGHQTRPAIAYDGVRYVVVWTDTRNGTEDIYAARVSTTGTVLDASPIPIAVSQDQERIAFIHARSGSALITWNHRAATAPQTSGDIRGGWLNNAAGTFSPLGSIANVTRTQARASSLPVSAFCTATLVAWTGPDDFIDDVVTAAWKVLYGRRVTGNAVLDVTPYVNHLDGIARGDLRDLAIASDGTQCVILFTEVTATGTAQIVWGTPSIFARVVRPNPSSNSFGGLSGSRAAVAGTRAAEEQPAAVFDGQHYLVVWVHTFGNVRYVYHTLLRADMTPLRPELPPWPLVYPGRSDYSGFRTPTVATSGQGEFLVAYASGTGTQSRIAGLVLHPMLSDFTSISSPALGGQPTKITVGASWIDYDGDGDIDLFILNNGQSSQLFRNDLAGQSYTDVTMAAGLAAPAGENRGGAWGDYDNDGHIDFYLSEYGRANRLYRNNGNGTFSDVTAISGAVGNAVPSRGVAWADYDRDGYLDLYVTSADGDKLFHNNGDRTFTNVATGPIATSRGRAVTWTDYDSDGDMDVYVVASAWVQRNRLFRNDGNGQFSDVTTSSGLTTPAGPNRHAAWGDYDNDGNLDVYVVSAGVPNRLFRNLGNGTFRDVTRVAGAITADFAPDAWYDLMGQTRFTFSNEAVWGDYDNDGDLDLYVAAGGGINVQRYDKLLRNQGDGTFRVERPGHLRDDGFNLGVAAGDPDNDGDLDLYLANADISGGNQLLVNQTQPLNAWLEVELRPRTSNRSAIGTRVTASAGGRLVAREVQGGSGIASQHSPVLHFGLLNSWNVRIKVRWPSGGQQSLAGVQAGQKLVIVEP